ncbi:hypothetical protein Tco_0518803, partial [Tanacetum coccineum]
MLLFRCYLILGVVTDGIKAPAEWLRGLERHFEQRADGEIYFFDHIWIPSIGDVKKLKRRRIPLVKVRWNSRQGAEYT